MEAIRRLLLENKAWANDKKQKESTYFERLSQDQTPEFLWIGCSDSRVPTEVIVNAQPGEVFVHRNLANQVIATDFNSLSVIQYAVEVLRVKHVIVCGHYNCGGVKAALAKQRSDLVITNKWLMHIKDVYRTNREELEAFPVGDARTNRLVELNIIEQVHRLSYMSIIQHAWRVERQPVLHGWVYGLKDGIINQLIEVDSSSRIDDIYQYEEPKTGGSI